MRTAEALRRAQDVLTDAGLPEGRLEAEVLLMHAADLSREQLFIALASPLPDGAGQRLAGLMERRLRREPLAYIAGHREFFGLDFAVDGRVLVPRPETETLVELALTIARQDLAGAPCRIADVGTGCGAIAVSLAVELPQAALVATDSSPAALEVAARNCRRHGVQGRVTLLQGDLLAPVDGPVDVVVANLPYIAEAQWPTLQPEIRWYEPRDALVAGEVGLELVHRLLEQVRRRSCGPRWLLLEVGDGQAAPVARRSRELFPEAYVSIHQDLGGLDRGVMIRRATS